MNRLTQGAYFLLVFIFATLLNAKSYAQSYNFADIPWGARAQEVKSFLSSKSFNPGVVDKDGDIPFSGELAGHRLSGHVMFANDGAQKITFGLATPNNQARSVYRDLRQSLIEKYGKPSRSHEFFQKPYYSGDGYEDQAIRLGKGTFATYWFIEGGGALAIQITERLAVRIAYEGPGWGAEVDKRKAASRSAL